MPYIIKDTETLPKVTLHCHKPAMTETTSFYAHTQTTVGRSGETEKEEEFQVGLFRTVFM